MRCYYAYSIRIAKIQKLTVSNADKDMEQLEFSYTASRNTKWYSNFGK